MKRVYNHQDLLLFVVTTDNNREVLCDLRVICQQPTIKAHTKG